MRQFALTNALGKVWDLNNLESFFHDIKGLGQEHKVTYTQLGTKFAKEKDLLAQKNITGKIKFHTYSEYREFSLFIQHKPLILSYKSDKTYNIKVSVDRLDKTELGTGGLYCQISFKGLGTYYQLITAENMKEQTVTGKAFPYVYPYTYYDYSNGEVIMESDSVLESPTRISIFGPCTNPSYNHIVNGIKKASGKVNASIPTGNKLVIDAMEIPYSINEYTIDNVFVKDLYEKSDFSTERFIMLEYGKNKITFSHESSEKMRISVEGAIEYESV